MQACRQDARFPLRDANARCVPSEFPLLLVRALMCILYEYLETYVHNCRGTHVAVHLFFLKKRFRVSKMACAVFLSFVTSACTYFSVLYFELTSPKQYPLPPPLPRPFPPFPLFPNLPRSSLSLLILQTSLIMATLFLPIPRKLNMPQLVSSCPRPPHHALDTRYAAILTPPPPLPLPLLPPPQNGRT